MDLKIQFSEAKAKMRELELTQLNLISTLMENQIQMIFRCQVLIQIKYLDNANHPLEVGKEEEVDLDLLEEVVDSGEMINFLFENAKNLLKNWKNRLFNVFYTININYICINIIKFYIQFCIDNLFTKIVLFLILVWIEGETSLLGDKLFFIFIEGLLLNKIFSWGSLLNEFEAQFVFIIVGFLSSLLFRIT